MLFERTMEQLSRGRMDRLARVELDWCLPNRDSDRLLDASEEACKAFPQLTIAVIPEPFSWYPDTEDEFGDPVLVPRWKRWWYGLWWSGYTLSIYGPARDIQDYLRLLQRILEGE